MLDVFGGGLGAARAMLLPRPQPGYRVPTMLLADAWLDAETVVAPPADGMPASVRLPRLRAVFEGQGVPGIWVWMAEVESRLDPRARSRAGALGLYQLMPATAARFGLRVAPAVDERADPEKSARAAASYLGLLRRQFGCWTLALAAYNAGEGRIRGLMTRHGAQTFADLSPHLPAETRAYVPRVMMLCDLREDQRRGVPGARW